MQVIVVKTDGCKGVREPRTEIQETEYRQTGRDLIGLLKEKNMTSYDSSFKWITRKLNTERQLHGFQGE